MKLIRAFIDALFPAPEQPAPADLASLAIVRGGSGSVIHRAVNHYAGFSAVIDGSTESNDLIRNESGGWDLVNSQRARTDQQARKKTTGTFATLAEGAAQLRAVDDDLRRKYGGLMNAFAGVNYLESTGPESLAAVELALKLAGGTAPAPMPSL